MHIIKKKIKFSFKIKNKENFQKKNDFSVRAKKRVNVLNFSEVVGETQHPYKCCWQINLCSNTDVTQIHLQIWFENGSPKSNKHYRE